MKLLRSVLLLTAVLACVASAQAQADKAESAKLEGTWVGGVRSPAGKAKDGSATMVQISELTIKDGRITSCKDGKGLSLGNCESLALNPASKTLDATGDSKNGKKGVFQGIYRVNGDKLEWCAANPGIARPKDFFTTPQVQFHMVFDKKK
ncbi:MAG: hypothetical protein EBY09_12390 [Verrucomicrobia bacterium]|nr:hypothetical protein [Verrucomicrobiota bacterium]NBU11220.1 hypothetical protein [Pseudomonadota bacterium]NDA67417.1 hypothetical protein [Verrucomicrobiota bacterium]NDD38769.1 hypothetical protein [Verrucomicrobiota bacterium]NDE98769.1 hypothetical protein [Verrucomicrobiota bacterium]